MDTIDLYCIIHIERCQKSKGKIVNAKCSAHCEQILTAFYHTCVLLQLKLNKFNVEDFYEILIVYNSMTDTFHWHSAEIISQITSLLQTRKTANWLSEKMTNEGHAVALLSGELNVEERARVIDSFREGKEKVLITTNVTARGEIINVTNFSCSLKWSFSGSIWHEFSCKFTFKNIQPVFNRIIKVNLFMQWSLCFTSTEFWDHQQSFFV